jgi:hypothetical protein
MIPKYLYSYVHPIDYFLSQPQMHAQTCYSCIIHCEFLLGLMGSGKPEAYSLPHLIGGEMSAGLPGRSPGCAEKREKEEE